MSSRRRQVVDLVTVALLVGATSGAGGGPTDTGVGPAFAPRPPLVRDDDPGGAATYEAMLRQPLDPTLDATQALLRAHRQAARLPQVSLRLRAVLPDPASASSKTLATTLALHALGRWDPLGPGNIGGRSRTLLIHPDDPQVMLLGGVSGGLWRSDDGGGHWRSLTDRLPNVAVNSIAMDPLDHATIYIGTGEGYFREEVRGTWLPLRGAGIFRSDDGGATWQHLPATAGADFQWVNDLVASANHPRRVYAATRSGVWQSDDAGATWQSSLAVTAKGGCLDLEVRSDHPNDWLYAACGTLEQATVYRRVMRSDAAWEAVLSEPGMGRTTLAIAPSDPNVIYALAASNQAAPNGGPDQGLLAVYRSPRGGDPGSWEARVRNTDSDRLATLILTNPAAAAYRDCGWYDQNVYVQMGWYCNTLAVDPLNPDVVWAAGVDLFRSDDGGRTWGLASYWWLDTSYPSFAHADQHHIAFHPDYDGGANRTMFVTNDGGVFRTDDARAAVGRGANAICDPYASQVVWNRLNTDLGITQFYHGAAWPDGSSWIGGAQDNGTLLGGESYGVNAWQHVWGGDGGYVAVDPSNPQRVYAESQYFGFVRSSDGGSNFSDAVDGISDDSSSFLFITPFVLDTRRPARLWTGGRRLWRSDNRGSNWQVASTLVPGNARVSALAVVPGDNDTVLAGTTTGDILRTDSAGSAGSGTAWSAVRPRAGFVSSIACDPSDPQTTYATYAGFGGAHVWRSRDGGASWQAIDGSGATAVPDAPVHELAVDPTDSNTLLLGTDVGVLVSLDGGVTWGAENTGFAAVVTEAFDIITPDDGPPVVFAFTHGRGAWRVRLAPSVEGPRRSGQRVTGG